MLMNVHQAKHYVTSGGHIANRSITTLNKVTTGGQDGRKQENHLGENEQPPNKKEINYNSAQRSQKKKQNLRERTDWANDDCTTYRDVDCWIKVLTLRLSLRP